MGLNKFAASAVMAVIWVMIGIIGTMWAQGLHFITAAYVVVQIVTTIGYGDIPVNPNMHWFMVFYVILGLCVAANVVNDVFNHLLERSQQKLQQRMNEVEEHVKSGGKTDNTTPIGHHERTDLLAALAIILLFVLGGAAFYMFEESCTCSYGVSKIPGCLADTCTTTGGYQKDFAQSIYMSVITLTTVGFGDFTPRSRVGRIFGFFWMITGVLAFGNFVTAFGTWIDAVFKKDKSSKFGRQIFDSIDRDNNGFLTRGEFMSWMLIKEGIVSSEQIDQFYTLFDVLAAEEDSTAGGLPKLGFQTLATYFHNDDEAVTSEEEGSVLLSN